MKDLDLKKKLLIQSTLGDFVELMKKEFGFTNETSDNGEEVKPAPLSKKRYCIWYYWNHRTIRL